MLIPGKPHSRGKSCNSWVSIKTLDFARVSTRRDGSWIASRGAKGGGIADRSPTLFPANAGTPSPPADDRQPAVARPKRCKTPGREGYRGSATGDAQWPISPRCRAGESPCPPPLCRAPLDNRLTSWADGCTQNGGQQPGVRTIGRYLSVLSCSLYRQTEVAAFALPGRCSGVTRVISARHLPLLPPTT